jgi:hypothetical protein
MGGGAVPALLGSKGVDAGMAWFGLRTKRLPPGRPSDILRDPFAASARPHLPRWRNWQTRQLEVLVV